MTSPIQLRASEPGDSPLPTDQFGGSQGDRMLRGGAPSSGRLRYRRWARFLNAWPSKRSSRRNPVPLQTVVRCRTDFLTFYGAVA